MKIMHVLQSSSFSGAENVVIQIIKMLQKNDNLEGIYVSSKGPIEKVLVEQNVNYFLFDELSFRNVKKAISIYKPDIIHAHDFQASVICSLVKTKEVLISHIHCNPPWLKGLNVKTLLYAMSTFRINKILTVSSKIKQDYVFRSLIEHKSYNVGNPYSVKRINDQVANSYDDIEFDVIFVGRLEVVKDPMRFINIISRVKKHKPNVRAAMVGGGSLYSECENYIANLSLNSNISLFGFQENPYEYIKKSKMLCITSKNEGYSLVALEAIALSKPVISVDVGELPNIIDDSCGILSNNEEVLSDEIVKLLENKDFLIEKSLNAQLRANKLENYNDYESLLINLYEK